MTRTLYRGLVWLHPPVFRREFAGEMLWIYDETAQAGGVAPLFLDGFVSLARQWLLRSGYWKVPAALAGALLQILIGGAALRLGEFHAHFSHPVDGNTGLGALMRLVAVMSVGLLAAVISLVFWWRKLRAASEPECSNCATSRSGSPRPRPSRTSASSRGEAKSPATGAERLREVHHPEDDHRPHGPERRTRSSSMASASAATPWHTASASATFPKSPCFIPISPARSIWKWSGSCAALRRRARGQDRRLPARPLAARRPLRTDLVVLERHAPEGAAGRRAAPQPRSGPA